MKITADQKVPNLVLGHGLERLKVPLTPNDARPIETKRQFSAAPTPALAPNSNPASPPISFLKSADSPSRIMLPPPGGGAPIERPTADANGPRATDLVALSVDPANSTDQFSLPTGNRSGQFSIARPDGPEGSPNGAANGVAGGGTGQGIHGGDSSIGVGSGATGGGGSTSAVPGPLSIDGSNAASQNAMLDAALPTSMVFPVAPPPLNVRRHTVVISAGPIGGGALNVYGVLSCGKIYSVFLPMPGRNWTMQYCDRSASAKKPVGNAPTTSVRLETPLIPPDLDFLHRYDFKRAPVPPEKSQRMIILKGTIAADGSVQNLTVYKGVLPVMDEAARLAFARWKFKPAMRDGKPIEVEILVGIPPVSGEDRVNR